MSIRKTIALASTLALTVLTLTTTPASARSTREFLNSFGTFGEPAGVAVDLETGNVYVTDNKTDTVDVFGATGGPSADGVPSQITGLSFNEPHPAGIAVDNSCYEHEPRLTGSECEEYDPSYGDVYVVNQAGYKSPFFYGIEKFKLSQGGQYELAGEIPYPKQLLMGLSVDARGNVYVSDYFSSAITEYKKVVEKVVNGGHEEVEEKLEEIAFPQHVVPITYSGYVAVDDLGNIYASSWVENGTPSEKGVANLKVDESGDVSSEEVLAEPILNARRPIAVDRSTNGVYVGDGPEIAEYSSAGMLRLTFGSTAARDGSLGTQGLSTPSAIAVNGETGLIYVANPLGDDVDVFGPVIGPPVIAGVQPGAANVTGTSALLAATVNPESGDATYHMEYVNGAEYTPAAANPYANGGRTAESPLAPGHAPVRVERIVLTGLTPGTTYDYRVVATNAAETTYGPDETFTTAAGTPPVASTGAASEVTATSVTLAGVVAPRGLASSYVFEVGTDATYGGAKLFGNAGTSTGEVPVVVGLQYLVPDTTYHYRLVATSLDGTSYGQDGTFTTSTVPSPIGQPAATALIPSPTVRFPSIAGAITAPVGGGKSTKQSAKSKRKHRAKKQAGKRKRKRELKPMGGAKRK